MAGCNFKGGWKGTGMVEQSCVCFVMMLLFTLFFVGRELVRDETRRVPR